MIRKLIAFIFVIVGILFFLSPIYAMYTNKDWYLMFLFLISWMPATIFIKIGMYIGDND